MSATTLEEIALSMVQGLGPTSTRRLIDIVGSASALFQLTHNELNELFGQHREIAAQIKNRTTFNRAEEEIKFNEKHGIKALFFTNDEYPQRMNRSECDDCPVLIYVLGNSNLNNDKMISIVGTRRATYYGKEQAERIVDGFVGENITVVSGLAYGIDTTAHRASVDRNIPTIAVLGHGLDRIYPVENTKLAREIIEKGGALVTEYVSGTAINPHYFPARNRIIAGMSDAVVVVEASEKGGALITANIANSYHREVFAVPGRNTDPLSKGCNRLIATNKAYIACNTDEICYVLNWQKSKKRAGEQTRLFDDLSPDEEIIVNLLKSHGDLSLDELTVKSALSLTQLSAVLFDLELKNMIKCLPGKFYKLI